MLERYLTEFKFKDNPQETQVENWTRKNRTYRKYINEYWTSKQRDASSLHEVSYRACFKPQLPRFL
jgi:hypothetical protein